MQDKETENSVVTPSLAKTPWPHTEQQLQASAKGITRCALVGENTEVRGPVCH